MAVKEIITKGVWHAEGPILRGKTVIVTGATSGIGLETAAEAARYGGRVIMACRNLQKADRVRSNIVSRLKSATSQSEIESRLIVKHLDLANFSSVRAFADETLRSEKRIDVLINNAGVNGSAQRTFTENGLEETMGVNHFGHFLLTELLLPLLKSSAPARIVVNGGETYIKGKVDFQNLNSEKSYKVVTPMGLTTAYCDSKVANFLHVRQLATKVDSSKVIVTGVLPGAVRTALFNRAALKHRALFTVAQFMMKSPLAGANSILYVAASQLPAAQVNGGYYHDCAAITPKAHATDAQLAAQFWDVSEKITGLK